ncbi:MAG TPA: GLUG motif-containing protein [Prolixibacteraceae bacterium]
MKKTYLFFVVIAFLMAGCQKSDDLSSDLDIVVKWDGTAALTFDTKVQPFLISTPAQLKLLSDIVNGVNTNPPSGATSASSYQLSKNIDLNNLDWQPIGTKDLPFKGSFDGNTHTIKGMYINSVVGYQGLFGSLEGGTLEGGILKKINLIDCNITAGEIRMNLDFNGAIVGYNKNGIVEECTFSGTLTNNGNAAGGIVGKSEGTNARVAHCQNLGIMIGNNGCRIGGIVGYNVGGLIEYCSNYATIKGGSYYTGGIAGQSYNGTVKNCGNSADVGGSACVGGVVGVNMESLISNCYNTGNLSGYTQMEYGESYGEDMGGIAGYNSGTLTNCYNTGSINTPAKEQGYYIGGVVGFNQDGSVINYCYYLKGCAKDGLAVYQNGFGAETTDSTTVDTDGSTNAITEEQGKASQRKTGINIGNLKYNVHPALLDCLNAWQNDNKTGYSSWTLTGSKTGYPTL